MSNAGYRGLVALLTVLTLAGLFAAGPTRAELGVVPAMTCDQWIVEREEHDGDIRLTDCTIDARYGTYRSDSRAVSIPIEGAHVTADSLQQTMWSTEDPEWVRLVRAYRDPDWQGQTRDAERRRFIARHEHEMVRRGFTVEGNANGPVIDSTPHVSMMRPFGITLFVLSALALALLARAQRRWRERSARLGGSAAKPTTF